MSEADSARWRFRRHSGQRRFATFVAQSAGAIEALAANAWHGAACAAFFLDMRTPIAIVIAVLELLVADTTSAQPPILRPGSADLKSEKLTDRCDSLWFLARAPGDTMERAILAQRSELHVVSNPQRATAVLVSTGHSNVDSAIVLQDGLAPILETTHSGSRVIRYRYDRSRVDLTTTVSDSAPDVRHHEYPYPVFNFAELDLLIRSLPLRPGYQALLPLYSEGDEDAEIDTVLVKGKDSRGIWRVRFADKAVVGTYGIAEDTRAEVSYSHRFRRAGPSWSAGTVWRRAFHACSASQAPAG